MDHFFEMIVTEHQKVVFGLLVSLVKDQHLAEDLTQETFMVLFRKSRQMDTSRPILPWLLKTARNLAANARRRQMAKCITPDKDDQTVDFWQQISSPSLGATWDDRLEKLADCCRQLPLLKRGMLELFYCEGCTAGQIASKLDMPVVSVYNHLARSRRLLYDCIRRKSPGDINE